MKKQTYFRLFSLVFVLVVFMIIGKYSSFSSYFQLSNITSFIRDQGVLGYFIFIPLLVAGSFIQIPVFLFVVAALLTYGVFEGSILGFTGVFLASVANFYFVRYIGGKPLARIKSPFIQRILHNLHRKPMLTVILLRFFFWGSPLLNFTLGLTKISSWKYILGSVLGLILPFIIFVVSVLFFREWVMEITRF